MSRLVNTTSLNGDDGWSFLILGKVAPVCIRPTAASRISSRSARAPVYSRPPVA